jgi:predicted RNA binding protein YcfA (HicA-like mRNA interferase family)
VAKLPRDIDGAALARGLQRVGYVETRQTGSHVRLTTQQNGEHHATVPLHRPLKVGTLAAILDDVAAHLRMTREQLLRQTKL